MDQKVTVKMLTEYFGYTQITGDAKSLEREIVVPDVNRPGFELSGYYSHTVEERLVIMGDKEISYIKTMSVEKQKTAFDFLTNDKTPMILVCHEHHVPEELVKIANEKNFPVFQSNDQTRNIVVDIVSYLEEMMAVSETMHGTFLNIYGLGTVITGESGVGKSEIALELLRKGHTLVADDRVDYARIHNRIIGQAPELLRDMLEIRGVGILNVNQMMGVTSTLPKADINLVIHLQKWNPETKYTRIGNEERNYQDMCGVNVPKILLPVSEGRSMATVIEAAVINEILLRKGINCPKEFEDRVYSYILNKKENG